MSAHFQILVAGTFGFLVILFSVALPPHTNTHEQRVAAMLSCILWGVLTVGGYVAFVAVVAGHALFGYPLEASAKRPRSGSETAPGQQAD